MKEIELAKKLKEAGFPSITRWEIENNYHRKVMANGDEMLPPMGAILSEIKIPIGIEKKGNKIYSIYHLHQQNFKENETYDELSKRYHEQYTQICKERGWDIPQETKTNFPISLTYRDDDISNIFYGETPEIVLALFYIEMKNILFRVNKVIYEISKKI